MKGRAPSSEKNLRGESVAVSISGELYRDLRRSAKRHDLSVNLIVDHVVSQALDKEGAR